MAVPVAVKLGELETEDVTDGEALLDVVAVDDEVAVFEAV